MADYEGLTHEKASYYMRVSISTFGRILRRVRKVVAKSIIEGKALKIEEGNYTLIAIITYHRHKH